MNDEEIKAIAKDMASKQVPYVLVAIIEDGKALDDHYFCNGTDKVAPEDMIVTTVGEMALHLLEEGNSVEVIKEEFNNVIDEAIRQFEGDKMLS